MRTQAEKVKLIPNFVDLAGICEVSRENAFSREHGLIGKFVLTYAGNMGVPQNLGVMIELARRIPDLTVLLIGGGGDEERLKLLAKGLVNVRFVDYQPISRMPEIYASSDLFYVGQDPKACSDGIPSKIYRILGNRKPILVMTSENSDLAAFVRDSNSGLLIDGDYEQAAVKVRQVMQDEKLLARYRAAGYAYVKAHFSREVISGQYEALCRQVIS